MNSTSTDAPSSLDDANKRTRIKAAAWTACVPAVLVLATVDEAPNWPEAFILGCVIAMAAFVCHQILHYR